MGRDIEKRAWDWIKKPSPKQRATVKRTLPKNDDSSTIAEIKNILGIK